MNMKKCIRYLKGFESMKRFISLISCVNRVRCTVYSQLKCGFWQLLNKDIPKYSCQENMSSLIPVTFLDVIHVFNDTTRNTCKVLLISTQHVCLCKMQVKRPKKCLNYIFTGANDQLFKVTILLTFFLSRVHLLPLSILKRQKVLYHFFLPKPSLYILGLS